MAIPITPVRIGDVVRLKKAHPCGANEWEITRVGMDIGLACCGCGRRVRLVRYEFDRRFRSFIRRSGDEGVETTVDREREGGAPESEAPGDALS